MSCFTEGPPCAIIRLALLAYLSFQIPILCAGKILKNSNLKYSINFCQQFLLHFAIECALLLPSCTLSTKFSQFSTIRPSLTTASLYCINRNMKCSYSTHRKINAIHFNDEIAYMILSTKTEMTRDFVFDSLVGNDCFIRKLFH